jgi:hypothetical protein
MLQFQVSWRVMDSAIAFKTADHKHITPSVSLH